MKSSSDGNLHIPSLDGIRAVATMMVFVSHAGLEDIVPGGFGVTIFFFLSGYLITTLLRLEFMATGSISLRNFYLRRVFRIFPPMYIVLAIAALLAITGYTASDMTIGGLSAQFLHFTNYFMIFFDGTHLAPATDAMWSLAVEEHFYLLFPIALLLLLRRQSYARSALFLSGFCVLVLLWRCVLVYGFGLQHDYTYLATDTRLDSILYGAILGLWLNPALKGKASDTSRRLWLILLGLGAIMLLFSFWYRNSNFRETFRYSLQGLGLFPFFYCAVRFNDWAIFRWLELRPIRLLGLISYTFYLCHQTALVEAERLLQTKGLFTILLGFAFSLSFSAAMYFLVERRMAVLRRRLHSNYQKRQVRQASK
jgi:peptidoglycan/LPS O-acetylase OafA/YrhL